MVPDERTVPCQHSHTRVDRTNWCSLRMQEMHKANWRKKVISHRNWEGVRNSSEYAFNRSCPYREVKSSKGAAYSSAVCTGFCLTPKQIQFPDVNRYQGKINFGTSEDIWIPSQQNTVSGDNVFGATVVLSHSNRASSRPPCLCFSRICSFTRNLLYFIFKINFKGWKYPKHV